MTHKAGNTIPWENWLYGAFFRGFQKAAGPCYIIFIYRPDVMAALCTKGFGSVGVDMTRVLFKSARGLSVSPLFPDGMGLFVQDGVPDPSSNTGPGNAPPHPCILRCCGLWVFPGEQDLGLPPTAQLLPGETRPPAQPILRAQPTDALPPAPQMGEKTTHCIQGPELSGARPPPFSHPAPKHQPSVPLPGLSRGARSPRLPPIPAGTQPSLPRSGFPGLGCTRTEQLIYHPCAAPALRLLFATEKLGGKRKNFSSWPRQELKTYALAANTSPGARGDPGEPSTGFSTTAPAGVQPSCWSRCLKVTQGLGMVTARSPPPSQHRRDSGMQCRWCRMAPLSSWMAAGQVQETNILTEPILDLLAGLPCRISPLHEGKPQGQMSLTRQGTRQLLRDCIASGLGTGCARCCTNIPKRPCSTELSRLASGRGLGWIHKQPVLCWGHPHPHPHPCPHPHPHPCPHPCPLRLCRTVPIAAPP